MKIKRLRVKDFRALGNIDITFDPDKIDCTAISAPYGTGKSALIDAIVMGLTGEKKRGEAVDDCIRIGADKMFVGLDIEINSHMLTIERTRKRGGGKTLRVLYDGVEPEGDKGYSDVQAHINSLLGDGVSRKVLEASVVGGQGKIEQFIDADPSERRDVLSMIIGGQRFTKRYAKKLAGHANKVDSELNSTRALLAARENDAAGIEDMKAELNTVRQLVNENKLIIAKLSKQLADDELLVAARQKAVTRAKAAVDQVNDLHSRHAAVQDEIKELNIKRETEDTLVDRMANSIDANRGKLMRLEIDVQLLKKELQVADDALHRSAGIISGLELIKQRIDSAKLDKQSKLNAMEIGINSAKTVFAQEMRALNNDGWNVNVNHKRNVDAVERKYETRRGNLLRIIKQMEEIAVPSLAAIGCDGSGKCSLMTAANNAADKLPGLQAELASLDAEMEAEISELNSAAAKAVENINRLKAAADARHKNKLKELGDARQQIIDDSASVLSGLEAEFAAKSAELSDVSGGKDADTLRRDVDSARARVEAAEDSIRGLNKRLTHLMQSKSSSEAVIQGCKAKSEALEDERLRLEEQIADLNKVCADYQRLVSEYNRACLRRSSVKGKLDNALIDGVTWTKKVAVFETRLAAMIEAGKQATELARQVNKKAEEVNIAMRLAKWARIVPHMVINQALPAIEAGANFYLNRITHKRVDGPLSIHFPLPGDDEYYSGKRERLDIIAADAVGARDVRQLSGGEKGWVSLALRFAMAEVAIGSGTGGRIDGNIGFIILDEPLTGLDPDGLKEFPFVINGLVNGGHQVLLVSHIDSIRDIAQRTIELMRVAGAGTIVAE